MTNMLMWLWNVSQDWVAVRIERHSNIVPVTDDGSDGASSEMRLVYPQRSKSIIGIAQISGY
jgi:hypothetical protein